MSKIVSMLLPTIPSVEAPFAVSGGLYLYSKYRGELSSFSSDNVSDRLGFYSWWEQFGASDYPGLEWKIRPIEKSYLDSLTVFSIVENHASALIWWLKGNHTSHLESVHLFDRGMLCDLVEIKNSELPIFLPLFIKLIWESRKDLQLNFNLESAYSVLDLIRWWNEKGYYEYPRISWSSINETLIKLRSHYESKKAINTGVPWYVAMIYEGRADLRAIFDINTPTGASEIASWWRHHGLREYPFWAYSAITSDPFFVAELKALNAKSIGINLVGFPRGILGLGEDVRLAKIACENAQIPHKVIEAPISGPEKLDHSLVDKIDNGASYPISLFCLPPTDMGRMVGEKGCSLIENIAYGIGAWPWELSYWPANLRVDGLVDEIWAQSEFVASVFRRFTSLPVTLMPHTVEIPTPDAANKESFGFRKEDFVYLVMFDGNSWLTRKNPLGSINAYLKAFPFEKKGVGLLIKSMNIRPDDMHWKIINDQIKFRSDIKVVNTTMNRRDVINLMAAVDAYISLHRSEGFGRIIAESMLLGKPTIVSNYSGNVDFCKNDTSYLVGGSLTPLKSGDYLFWEGQQWFDPSISEASQRILDVYEDFRKRENIAEAGMLYIKNNYSAKAVGKRYEDRINSILDAMK